MSDIDFIDFLYLSWYYYKAKILNKFRGMALAIGLHLNKEKKDEVD